MSSLQTINDEFNRMVDILNNPIKKRLRREFNRVQKLALSQYQETGAIDDEVFIEHRAILEEIAFDGFNRSQAVAAKRQLIRFEKDGLSKKQRLDIERGLKIDFQDFAFSEAQKAAEIMAQTTKDTILSIIDKQTRIDEEKERNGLFDIIREARREAQERSIWRSFVGGLAIIHGGANRGEFQAAGEVEKSLGWRFVKIWITRQDDKVRDTHRPMHGKRIAKGELFAVPAGDGATDMMRYPGDRRASIGNWINCRCSTDLQKEKTDG